MKYFYCAAVLGMWLGAGTQISASGQGQQLSFANPEPSLGYSVHLAFEQAKHAKKQEPTMVSDFAATLQGEPWLIISSAFSEMLPDKPAQVTFDADGLRLEAPCNIYMSKADIGAGAIVIFPFENMPKTCGPEAMEVEGALLRAFARSATYSVTEDGELLLLAADGAEMIRARR